MLNKRRKTAALFTAFYVQKKITAEDVKLTVDFKLSGALRALVTLKTYSCIAKHATMAYRAF